MAWIADPLNLLVVDSTHRQPDFIGWYGYNNDLLNTTLGLRLGKGLKLGKSQATNVIRNGNGNDTLTLSAGQAITSHPKVSGKYATSIPAVAGNTYTLGVTSTGIAPFKTARTKFSIVWVNSTNDIISETAQGILSSYNVGVRNWVRGIAPVGAVGMVVLFSTDLPVTLSFPTLALGIEDIRKGDPTFDGDQATSNTNLFYKDPESSAIPWLDGWSDQFGHKITPTNTVLSVPANSEARLYFREDADTPTTMGIQVQPNSEYFFALTEAPTRTAATVRLKIYDLAGVAQLATFTPTENGNKLQFSFNTPVGAAWLAIKIVTGGSATTFTNAVLVSGLEDPGGVGPTYGNFQKYFQFISDTRNVVSKRVVFTTENFLAVTKNTQFRSDNLDTIGLNAVQLRSANLQKITKTFEFRSDNTDLISKRIEFLSDNTIRIGIQTVFLTNSMQKIPVKNWVLNSNLSQTKHKTFEFKSDTLQIVGQRPYQGGLETSLLLLTDEELMTQYSTRKPSRSWLFSADLTIDVATDFQFLSDNLDTVSKTYVLNSDTTNHVVRGVIFTSDTTETKSWLFSFKSDTIGPFGTIEFVLLTDSHQKVEDTTEFLSDIFDKVVVATEFKSDNTKTVSRRFKLRSSVNGRRRPRVISSRPLYNIGSIMTSSSTSPLPNPEGDYVFSPKVIGQASRTRQEISQYSTPRLGMNIIADGNNIDPESIKLTLYQKLDFSPNADPLGQPMDYAIDDLDHEEVGVFSVVLDPTISGQLSQLALQWEYVVDGTTYQYWDYYQILGYMPTYEALNDGEKSVIRQVAAMFEDLYDSVEGGPHLKEEFQTHFGTERIAQMMELAMNRINITSQPYTNYNIGAGTGPRFPASGYSLLVMGTYLEVVRHLIRSYTEMPTMQGSPGVAFYDRSNYVSRWRDVLQDEAEDYKAAVRSFKRSLMGLGGGALIVAGGIYGSAAYWRSGTYSAMARAARFSYPTSVVQVRPGAS